MKMHKFLEKLLNGQKVDWRQLKDIILPVQNVKWKNQDGVFKYIDLTSVDLKDNKITQTTDIDVDTAPSRAQRLVETDDIIFATTRPTQMRIAIIPQQLNGQIASTGYCVLRANKKQVLPKWIYFNLSSILFREYLEENQSGSAYPAISDGKLKEFQIPIPPLSVQNEIVQILDGLTDKHQALIAELAKEMQLRQKQYQYYLEKLLTFEKTDLQSLADGRTDGRTASEWVRWVCLGDVANYEQPNKYLVQSKAYRNDFSTPVLTAGKTFILGFTDEVQGVYMASKNPVIIFDDFTTANKWVDFDFKIKSSAIKIITSKDENKVLLKYIFYWLSTLSKQESNDHKRQWISNFANKQIPIPPLSHQAKIVAILDEFDRLTSSITDGLSKEIELRHKQYEYCREVLLTFTKF